MKKEKLQAQLNELLIEQQKLLKIKSASPVEIIERRNKIRQRIERVEAELVKL